MRVGTWRLLVKQLGLAWLLGCSNGASAQTAPAPPAPTYRLEDLIRQAMPPGVARADERLLLLVPALALTNSSLPTQFEQFNRIPGPAEGVYAARNETVLGQLKILDADIEVSPVVLDESQKKSLLDAWGLLFSDPAHAIRTRDYERYTEYQSKFNKLREQLSVSTSPAEKSNLQQQLTIARQEWDTYGKRALVGQALDTVAKLSEDKTKQLHSDWSKTLTPDGVSDFSNFWDLFSNTSDWTSINVPASTGDAPLVLSNGTTPISIASRSMGQITFKYKVFLIPRLALSHSFLRARNWRNGKSYVISDGLPQDNPSELVPRVVTGVVVVKGIELVFSSRQAWQTVDQYLAREANVNFGGFVLKAQGRSLATSLPSYISLNGPVVFAALVANVPQIPATGPSDSWPLWWIPR